MTQQKYCQAHLVQTPAVAYISKRWRCASCRDRINDASSRGGKQHTAPSSPFTANLQPRIVASPAPYVPMRELKSLPEHPRMAEYRRDFASIPSWYQK